MGVDITMHLIDKDGNYVKKDLYDGRNTDWFNNLQGRDSKIEYEYFPKKWGLPEKVPAEELEAHNYGDYYGHHYIKLKDLIDWYWETKPYLTAGWVTAYDKWLYETKNIIPDEIINYLDEEDRERIDKDLFFCEFSNPYEHWTQILENIGYEDKEDYIIYYFDC